MKTLCRGGICHSILLLIAIAPVSAKAQITSVVGHVELMNGQTMKKEAKAPNVVIWLEPTVRGTNGTQLTSSSRAQRPRLVQKDKTFRPHLLVIEAGTSVEFPNQDPFFHSVFSLFNGQRFDLGLYEAGTTRTLRFDKPGVSYIFCNIHPEMSAVVLVLDTPFFGISDATGNVTIPAVPPGRYLLRAWNERAMPETLKSISRELTISEAENSFGIVSIVETDSLNLTHKNKYGQDYIPPSSPVYPRP